MMSCDLPTNLLEVPSLLDVLIANTDTWLDEGFHQVSGVDTQQVGDLLSLWRSREKDSIDTNPITLSSTTRDIF